MPVFDKLSRILVSVFVLTLFAGTAKAQGGSAALNVIPTAVMFPTPGGILFPSITCAGGVDPAALPLYGRATAVQAAYSNSGQDAPQDIFGSVAATSRNFGLGLGYFGDSLNSHLTSSGFAGAGFKLDPISLGVGLRDQNLSASGNSSLDLGMIAGEGKGTTFGFVFYGLNNSPQLAAGLGYGGGKKYNMEVNVVLPPFNDGGGGYLLTVAGTIYAGDSVGLSFRTSYFSQTASYFYSLGAVFWLSDKLSVLFQFSTPRTWTGGLTLMF